MKVKNEIAQLEQKLAGYETPKEAISKAISLLDYLPNGVASWVEAYGGDKGKADKNGKIVKQIVKQLGEVLMDMPEPTTFEVIGMGVNDKEFKSREELVNFLKSKGIKQTGTQSGSHLRAELQGQPTFDKLVGPMHGGGGKVRYETSEVNDALSR